MAAPTALDSAAQTPAGWRGICRARVLASIRRFTATHCVCELMSTLDNIQMEQHLAKEAFNSGSGSALESHITNYGDLSVATLEEWTAFSQAGGDVSRLEELCSKNLDRLVAVKDGIGKLADDRGDGAVTNALTNSILDNRDLHGELARLGGHTPG